MSGIKIKSDVKSWKNHGLLKWLPYGFYFENLEYAVSY